MIGVPTMTPEEIAEWEAKARSGALRAELGFCEVESLCAECGHAFSNHSYSWNAKCSYCGVCKRFVSPA